MGPIAARSGVASSGGTADPDSVGRVVIRDGARTAARFCAVLVALVAFDLLLGAVVWWQLLRP